MGSPWDLRRAQNLFLTSQWDLCELWTTSEKFSKFCPFVHSLTWLSILTWSLGYCYRSQLHNLTGHLGQNSWIYTKRQESFSIGHWTRDILAYRSLKSVDFHIFLKSEPFITASYKKTKEECISVNIRAREKVHTCKQIRISPQNHWDPDLFSKRPPSQRSRGFCLSHHLRSKSTIVGLVFTPWRLADIQKHKRAFW